MAETAKSICNRALGLLGNSKITNIDPPRSPLEIHVAETYPSIRDSELKRGRWVFTIGFKALTYDPLAPDATAERAYGFVLPTDYLGMVKDKNTRWQIRGNRLYSPYATQVLEYRKKVAEGEFDPLFVDVLAARLAIEWCEYVTQSNTKAQEVERKYINARKFAVAENSLVLDQADTEVPDEQDEWIAARAGYNL